MSSVSKIRGCSVWLSFSLPLFCFIFLSHTLASLQTLIFLLNLSLFIFLFPLFLFLFFFRLFFSFFFCFYISRQPPVRSLPEVVVVSPFRPLAGYSDCVGYSCHSISVSGSVAIQPIVSATPAVYLGFHVAAVIWPPQCIETIVWPLLSLVAVQPLRPLIFGYRRPLSGYHHFISPAIPSGRRLLSGHPLSTRISNHFHLPSLCPSGPSGYSSAVVRPSVRRSPSYGPFVRPPGLVDGPVDVWPSPS